MANFLVASPNTLSMQGTVTTGIHTCFGRGNDLGVYRGTTYYTSSGGSGTFPASPNSISYSNFHDTGPDPSYSANYNGKSVETGIATAHNTTLYIYSDGSMAVTTTASSGTNLSTFPANWYLPTTASIGSGYYFRVSQTVNWVSGVTIYYNGGATVGSNGTWYSLTNYGRLYGSVTNSSARDVTITLDISNNASTVIGTGTISWKQNTANLP